jgi:hypothetical protein
VELGGCCATATIGNSPLAPQRKVMHSRRLMSKALIHQDTFEGHRVIREDRNAFMIGHHFLGHLG